MVYIIGPRLHKASKADRFRDKMQEDVKGVSRDSVREVRYDGRGRWGRIPSIRHSVVGYIYAGQYKRKSRVRT